MEKKYSKDLHKVIQIDEDKIKDHLGNLVKKSVEDTLNAMLDAEALNPSLNKLLCKWVYLICR